MKNKINKGFVLIALAATIITSIIVGYSPINANNTTASTKIAATAVAPVQNSVKSAVSAAPAITVAPLELVANPAKYLNKNIKFKATFDKFSSLGLDYKPAMKTSQDYIGILIKRDDVKDNIIPLSELKMFMERKSAEKFIDIDSGDIIEVEGSVFSNALGDPWVDIKKFSIISHVNKKADDNKKAENTNQ